MVNIKLFEVIFPLTMHDLSVKVLKIFLYIDNTNLNVEFQFVTFNLQTYKSARPTNKRSSIVQKRRFKLMTTNDAGENTQWIICVCIDTYVIYQSVLEKKDL